MRLNGKVALVTGGNSGIGYGIAQDFKSEGVVGVIVGRNKTTLNESVQKLGSDFMAVSADVTKMEDLDRMYEETTGRFGKIDVLVVNAGGAIGPGSLGSLADVTEESYDRMVALNMKSVYFTVQKALPYLNKGASIILVASIAVHKAFPGLGVYSACKAGVRSMARSFSSELLEQGIRVNVLSPGTIDTPLFGSLGIPDEAATQAKAQFEELIPLKRMGTAQEMGKVATFLASSDSSFVIGEEIIADGGVVNL